MGIKGMKLMICAMQKVCARSKECIHCKTHYHNHATCYWVPGARPRFCLDFNIRPEAPTILETERPELCLDSRMMRLGFCTAWDYYKSNMTDSIHVLIDEWDSEVIYGRDIDDLRIDHQFSTFPPQRSKKKKTAWVSFPHDALPDSLNAIRQASSSRTTTGTWTRTGR